MEEDQPQEREETVLIFLSCSDFKFGVGNLCLVISDALILTFRIKRCDAKMQ